jgi:hypothetical protein
MTHPVPHDASRVEQLLTRIALLEQLLAINHIPVPPDGDDAREVLSPHLAFPELDFSENDRKEPKPIEVRSALEDFPHIAGQVTGLWGKDGFDQYLGKLIVDERGTRKGFSMDAMEELMLLGRISRQCKALFGMFKEARSLDPWKELPETERRAASQA